MALREQRIQRGAGPEGLRLSCLGHLPLPLSNFFHRLYPCPPLSISSSLFSPTFLGFLRSSPHMIVYLATLILFVSYKIYAHFYLFLFFLSIALLYSLLIR